MAKGFQTLFSRPDPSSVEVLGFWGSGKLRTRPTRTPAVLLFRTLLHLIGRAQGFQQLLMKGRPLVIREVRDIPSFMHFGRSGCLGFSRIQTCFFHPLMRKGDVFCLSTANSAICSTVLSVASSSLSGHNQLGLIRAPKDHTKT